MTEVTITPLPAAPLHALDIWSNAAAVATRFEVATGFALPRLGTSGGNDALRLIRVEPTVWLVEGDASGLGDIHGDDGALTAIGGGIVRIRLSGPGWRTLLMDGGMFDAESLTFAPGWSISGDKPPRLWSPNRRARRRRGAAPSLARDDAGSLSTASRQHRLG